MSTPEPYFDGLYGAAEDPYRYRTRWYEARKRQLLLAALPAPRFRSGWELGCSIGVTTTLLAEVCETVVATDFSARAITAARANVTCTNVEFRQADHPRDWLAGPFDLIVFSEVGYFMDRPSLRRAIRGLEASLGHDGTLVSCHWRRPFTDAPLDGDVVHGLMRRMLRLPHAFSYSDDDFRLDGWTRDARSVAAREFLA